MNIIFNESDKHGNQIKIAREVDQYFGFAFYIYAGPVCIWKKPTKQEAIDFAMRECLSK
jgi:hypothetical protein